MFCPQVPWRQTHSPRSAIRAEILAAFRAEDRPAGEGIDDYLARADTLMTATLESRPDLATPELMAGLNQAAEEGGIAGVATFLSESDVFPRNEYEGLGDLRDLLLEQEQAVGARLPTLLDEIYHVG